jgi:hypothetical protein
MLAQFLFPGMQGQQAKGVVMSLVLVMLGLTFLAVSCMIAYWLIGEYETRIQALEAQLRTRCPTCQAAAYGTAWGHPLRHST